MILFIFGNILHSEICLDILIWSLCLLICDKIAYLFSIPYFYLFCFFIFLKAVYGCFFNSAFHIIVFKQLIIVITGINEFIPAIWLFVCSVFFVFPFSAQSYIKYSFYDSILFSLLVFIKQTGCQIVITSVLL